MLTNEQIESLERDLATYADLGQSTDLRHRARDRIVLAVPSLIALAKLGRLAKEWLKTSDALFAAFDTNDTATIEAAENNHVASRDAMVEAARNLSERKPHDHE